MAGPLVFEIQLTPAELRSVILFSMLRRPGEGVRRFIAIAVGSVTLGVAFQRADAWAHTLGVIVALGCAWIALRPFFLARMLAQKPAPAVRLELSERGIKVTRAGKTAELGWDRITAQGRGPGFHWYEVQGAAIAAIPDRVVQDRPALEAMLARSPRR